MQIHNSLAQNNDVKSLKLNTPSTQTLYKEYICIVKSLSRVDLPQAMPGPVAWGINTNRAYI